MCSHLMFVEYFVLFFFIPVVHKFVYIAWKIGRRKEAARVASKIKSKYNNQQHMFWISIKTLITNWSEYKYTAMPVSIFSSWKLRLSKSNLNIRLPSKLTVKSIGIKCHAWCCDRKGRNKLFFEKSSRFEPTLPPINKMWQATLPVFD